MEAADGTKHLPWLPIDEVRERVQPQLGRESETGGQSTVKPARGVEY